MEQGVIETLGKDDRSWQKREKKTCEKSEMQPNKEKFPLNS